MEPEQNAAVGFDYGTWNNSFIYGLMDIVLFILFIMRDLSLILHIGYFIAFD